MWFSYFDIYSALITFLWLHPLLLVAVIRITLELQLKLKILSSESHIATISLAHYIAPVLQNSGSYYVISLVKIQWLYFLAAPAAHLVIVWKANHKWSREDEAFPMCIPPAQLHQGGQASQPRVISSPTATGRLTADLPNELYYRLEGPHHLLCTIRRDHYQVSDISLIREHPCYKTHAQQLQSPRLFSMGDISVISGPNLINFTSQQRKTNVASDEYMYICFLQTKFCFLSILKTEKKKLL